MQLSNIQLMYKSQQSTENTRAAAKGTLNYPKHRLHQYQQGAFYSSLKTWNSLPTDLRENDLKSFKRNLQAHMTKHYLEI